MHQLAEHIDELVNSDIQFSYAIYESIVAKINYPPELSIASIGFLYYDIASFYITTLFEFWLTKEQMVFLDQEEKDYFLELNRPKYEERLHNMLEKTWRDYFNFSFIQQAQLNIEYINSPLQNVW